MKKRFEVIDYNEDEVLCTIEIDVDAPLQNQVIEKALEDALKAKFQTKSLSIDLFNVESVEDSGDLYVNFLSLGSTNEYVIEFKPL